LQAKGLRALRSLSRTAAEDLLGQGVECCRGDLNDFSAVSAAVKGCDVVFHLAAKAGIWGSYKSYHQSNVVGTLNVLKACEHHRVKRLVYTSTASVVFNGDELSNVSEVVPYGRRWLCGYTKTKMLAERAVLAANGQHLSTVALRPHLIWGPGDNHLIPTLLRTARQGLLFQVGSGDNWVDLSYVEDVAEAHYLAMQALERGSVAGKAYFISQGDPIRLWEWINFLFEKLNLPRVRKRLPYKLAYGLGGLWEFVYKLLRISHSPPMTRFLAKELSLNHYFDISAAKMELQYLPKISNEEGMQRLVSWLQGQGRRLCQFP
jgi:nucleoside-diphosphate-sugar epimerase